MNKLLYLGLIILVIGCNNKNHAFNVKTVADSIPSQSVSEKPEFFNYKPDIRVFTVLAFLNAGGYEPFDADSIPLIRKEIRAYLDSIIIDSLKSEIKNICQPIKSHRFIVPQIYLALNLTYPPNFKWLPDSLRAKPQVPIQIKDKELYLKKLNEFYQKADIPALWAKYSPQLADHNTKYAKFGSKALKNITEFCRIDSNFYYIKYRKFNFYEEELANKGWGSIFISNDTVFYFMNYQVNGVPAFYHESLHLLINPITDHYYNLLRTKNDITNIGLDLRLKLGTYISVNDLFSECMVSTIDLTIREKQDHYSHDEISKNIDNKYNQGLILVPYLYNKLKEYQNQHSTLEQYYPEIIKGIDIEKEKTRWIETHNKPRT